MQRLSQHPWKALKAKDRDRGSVAVIVALLMIPLMAIAALAIDVGAMHVDRQQLQTGADAGALAIAQDCARDDCSAVGDTAQTMADLNRSGASGAVQEINESAGTVSVATTATREHWFAPIFGIESTGLEADASSRWGYPTGGTAVLPLAYSWCELEAQTGIEVLRDASGAVIGVDIPDSTPNRTIHSTKTSSTECTGRSNNVLPGGFGWLDPHPEDCGRTKSEVDEWVTTKPGNSPPSPCTNADFRKWVGKTVLLPIFDLAQGTGNNAKYQIFGYAAFTLSGYHLGGSFSHNAPCSSPGRCVRGSFNRFVDLSENFDYSPSSVKLGASVVALTE